jgi:hypothetical protein
MISAQQAADALKEVATTQKRSAQAYSYSLAAPYCFVWGGVWLLGYGAEALASFGHFAGISTGWWWTALTLAGVAASIAIGRAQYARRPGRSWRMGALFAIIWLFTAALFAVIHPKSELQVGAYFPLLFSAIYAAVGLWLGLRYILVGVFVALATLGAFFFLRDYFFAWMALVGGGALLLTGLWMRRA